jgi:hypothetical protein
MLEEESFNEFYTKISDLRNSMINLGKKIYDAELIKKILKSLLERFRIKVTTIEESKCLDNMKMEELVGSLQTYEFSLLPLRKTKSIALKTAKEKSENSSDEDGLAMFARNFRRVMNSSKGKFSNKNAKFSKNSKGDSKGNDQENMNMTKRIHVVLDRGVQNPQSLPHPAEDRIFGFFCGLGS